MNQIAAIQILRALAALCVVFSHAQSDALGESMRLGGAFTRWTVLPWDAGVDLFFVISGFIMVHASERLYETPGAATAFMTRRLVRIVPLYWLATVVSLAILGLVAWTGKHPFPSLAEIASSFGFLPFPRPLDGAPRPIVSLGWTLNYEMFFYLVFAMVVRLRREAAAATATLILLGIVSLGAVFEPRATALAYWRDPLVLEFAFGMALAVAWRRGWRFDRRVALAFAGLGIALLAADGAGMTTVGISAIDPNGFPRLLACGVPMALLFVGAVFGKRTTVGAPSVLRNRVVAFAMRIGDASYALYLFHPFALIAVRKAYLALHLDRALGFWPLVGAIVVVSIALAFWIHDRIEKPIAALLMGWRRVRKDEPFLGAAASKMPTA